jgi:GNAT superfamily N-acetyltransferase
VRVEPATTDEDYADVDRLIRAYLDELPFEVDFQDVDRELAELPAEYGPPTGAAVLVRDGAGHAVGFVGVRRFADHDAELKRMYLAPEVRGGGFGRSLAEAGVEAARSLGYHRLLLDTVDWMAPAISLYESLGFVAISPYRHNPLAGARFFALELPRP